jgi:hypothetical protein
VGNEAADASEVFIASGWKLMLSYFFIWSNSTILRWILLIYVSMFRSFSRDSFYLFFCIRLPLKLEYTEFSRWLGGRL